MIGPHAAPELDKVHRVLRYAASEDGERLWSLRYLEATCRPLLEGLVKLAATDAEAEALSLAADQLSGVDAMPWTRRLAPVLAALETLDPLLLAEPPPPPPEQPLVRLIEPSEEDSDPESSDGGPSEGPSSAEQESSESSAKGSARSVRGRRRGRIRKERTPEPSAEPVEAVAPPMPRLRYPLGAPGHSGRALSELDGADERLVAALAELGVVSIADLLQQIPTEQQRLPVLLGEEPIDEEAEEIAVTGQVIARFLRLRPMGRVHELLLRRGDVALRCRWLAALPSEVASLSPGDELTLAGRVELTDDGPVMYEAMPWTVDSRSVVRRPVYGLEGVADEDLWPLMRAALASVADQLVDSLPDTVLRDARILGLEEAFQALHVPTGGLKRARSRFAFEELIAHQLRLASAKPVRLRGIAHPIGHELIGRLQIERQFTLDDGQEAVFDEIRRDLRRPVAMTRLLQGDVGAGKTLVAMITAIMVAESKSQVIFLAPDAISAEHRYLFAEPMIRAAGLVPHLLVGDPSAAQLDALRRGEANVIFAAHDFIKGGLPSFRRLGLVIVEERGPYGVISREQLAQKNAHPDLLVVTAVPIPSSLTFTMFADHDISIIDGPSQQVVETLVRQAGKRGDTYARIIERLEAGQQALVCFPMVRGVDPVDLPTARQLAAALANEAFPGFKVGVYHGGMSREERARVFEDFERRRFHVLLSTTSIEDAPELGNVTALLVESADRYDLVRLHRLRGMVAKGRGAGLCFYILSSQPSVEGTRLVELVAREQDGFSIAEQDRIARGDEALLGERAGALPDFLVADPVRERDLFMRARRAALNLLAQDPKLKQRANRALGALVFGEEAPPEPPPPQAGKGRSRRRRRRRRGGK